MIALTVFMAMQNINLFYVKNVKLKVTVSQIDLIISSVFQEILQLQLIFNLMSSFSWISKIWPLIYWNRFVTNDKKIKKSKKKSLKLEICYKSTGDKCLSDIHDPSAPVSTKFIVYFLW